MRTIVIKSLSIPATFKAQLLHWANQFREIVFLDSNSEFNQNQTYKNYDFVLAVDAFTSIKTDTQNAFDDLNQYQNQTNDWLFGYLSYDLKNDIEALKSENFDGLQFPDLFFFQPKKIFLFKENQLEIQYLNLCDDEIETDFETILNTEIQPCKLHTIEIKQRISEKIYLQKVTTLLQHIHRGDLYEANFCMEFYAENCEIQPLEIYQKLVHITQTPFSCFFKNNSNYLICASPERYLKKQNSKIISQPIKGTSKRFATFDEDEKSKYNLQNNPKEKSENIMIVDLVRNDLAKTAVTGSVQVEELCQIHSFKQVHQLISTVVSEVENSVSAVEILKSTFPMGSMTGAPKIAAMQLIEELEETKRGLYSGAIGYFSPGNSFDFNVVIRSILYNSENKYLSFSVGSAITAAAIPEQEYQECLLKAAAMKNVLN